MKGYFITLEGIDGAGKSSHLDFIVEFFERLGREVVVTREPGGNSLSEALRTLLLTEHMNSLTEVLLMFASRSESVCSIIMPALAEGKIVISDRFTDSTLAYQGGGRNFSIDVINDLKNIVHPDLTPDLTLLFDVPLEVARDRLSKGRSADKFEALDGDFFNRVRNQYLSMANYEPNRFKVIDSSHPVTVVRRLVYQALMDFIGV
ncbi:thymidylate kinase [Taylorella asinigenitalis 14/45]|uniref:Thymidylate kinase n=1 Tax=Taylorella asinigenitalis 14/45 TaxID=1091495 RepID=I7JQR2_9BURK|nr:dTMP kinase [Taylorella asinigenitalis]CCG18884.1 thymidylate kinase [Taylorella asinigenitalis 14/45]